MKVRYRNGVVFEIAIDEQYTLEDLKFEIADRFGYVFLTLKIQSN